MKEYNVLLVKPDGEQYYTVLLSFWKLLFWFIRTAWQCSDIKIFIS